MEKIIYGMFRHALILKHFKVIYNMTRHMNSLVLKGCIYYP